MGIWRQRLHEELSGQVQYEITGKMPGINEIVQAGKNPRARNAMKKRAENSAVAQMRAQGLREVTQFPVVVTFDWRAKNRRRDPDNIAGAGQKILLDALQVAGILPNDGWSQIARIEHNFEISGAQDAVTITITEHSPAID